MSLPATLRDTYDAVSDAVASLDPEGLGRPTRAEAWDVKELLVHLLSDAPRVGGAGDPRPRRG